MPELPEVRTVVYFLNKNIKNLKFENMEIKMEKIIKEITPELLSQNIINSKIIKVSNYGKFILFYFENNNILLSHLRMEGKYRISSSPIWKKHDLIRWTLSNDDFLFYNDTRRFGTFHLRNKNSFLKNNPLAKLAKEPQNILIDAFFNKICKKQVAIKKILLDQTLILGIGNIYANEILWAVQIHPETKANILAKNQIKKILKSSSEIMDLATKLGGTTIKSFLSLNQQEGQYQKMLKVHNKRGEPCSRCLNKIQKIKVGGRGTYFCPFCQKKL